MEVGRAGDAMPEVDAAAAVMAEVDALADELVELAAALVKTPSVAPNYPGVDNDDPHVKGGEAACNALVAEAMRAFGCEVSMVELASGRPNAAGRLRGVGGEGARSVVLNGHVDVVPYGRLEDWERDPVGGEVSDGRLWGRGSCDMKGPVAAFVKGAEAVVRSGIRLRGDVILQSVIAEEVGESEIGTRGVLKAGFSADVAISTEPTGVGIKDGVPCIEIICPRAVLLALTVPGKSAHVGYRHELIHPGGRGDALGVNAIEKAMYVMQAVQQLEQNWSRISRPPFPPGKFVLHPGVIEGGTIGATVPYFAAEYCTIRYSIWFDPDKSYDELEREVEDFVLRACSLDPWLAEHLPTFEWSDHFGHHEIAPDSPLVQALGRAHARVMGRPVELRSGDASGDGVVMYEYGLPTLMYGPGDLSRAHAANEYIEVDELIRAAKVYALTMLDWCGAA